MRGFGSHWSANMFIRSHALRSFWLRASAGANQSTINVVPEGRQAIEVSRHRVIASAAVAERPSDLQRQAVHPTPHVGVADGHPNLELPTEPGSSPRQCFDHRRRQSGRIEPGNARLPRKLDFDRRWHRQLASAPIGAITTCAKPLPAQALGAGDKSGQCQSPRDARSP